MWRVDRSTFDSFIWSEPLHILQVVALHKTVRETLVFLTHLDHQQTEEVMIEKLGQQVHPAPGGQGWSRQVSITAPVCKLTSFANSLRLFIR